MNGEIAPEGLGCSPWQEMVRLLPANGARPNHKRTESRCNSNRSWPEVRAYEVSGSGTAGAGGNKANGNGFGKQSHERWQLHLNQLAKTRSKHRVLQIKSYVRDIFAEAVEQDFLTKDPARKVTVPSQLRDTDRTTLTWEQLRDALLHLALRDRVLLELDMTNALRPSELFALRWKCFNYAESKMQVFETAYNGAIRPWGKTRKSLGRVQLPKELAEDLWLWKQECPDSSPDAFIFPDAKGGFMDTVNYRKRVLHKLARDLVLPKLTLHVIRRTIATLAQKKGRSRTFRDCFGIRVPQRPRTCTCKRSRSAFRQRSTRFTQNIRKKPESMQAGYTF